MGRMIDGGLCGIVVSWILALIAAPPSPVGAISTAEYCELQSFSPICDDEQVIVMDTALYGRMRIGRCVETDLGFLGCHRDVLHLADRKCSGLQQCNIRIPDSDFGSTAPCHKELNVYLEAAYSCVRALTPDLTKCAPSHRLPVTGPPTHLLVHPANYPPCRMDTLSWQLAALPGQRINLTLVDLWWSAGGATGEPHCQEYARIVEPLTQEIQPLCGARDKHGFRYLSLGNHVHVTMDYQASRKTNRRFLIKLEAVGCPDLDPPGDGWMKRNGRDIQAGCQDNRHTWTLRCEGQRWNGTLGNCTQLAGVEPVMAAKDMVRLLGMELPYDVTIAVVVGAVVIICFFITCIGLVLFRRFYTRQPPLSPISIGSTESLEFKFNNMSATHDSGTDYEQPVQSRMLPWMDEKYKSLNIPNSPAGAQQYKSLRPVSERDKEKKRADKPQVIPTYSNSHLWDKDKKKKKREKKEEEKQEKQRLEREKMEKERLPPWDKPLPPTPLEDESHYQALDTMNCVEAKDYENSDRFIGENKVETKEPPGGHMENIDKGKDEGKEKVYEKVVAEEMVSKGGVIIKNGNVANCLYGLITEKLGKGRNAANSSGEKVKPVPKKRNGVGKDPEKKEGVSNGVGKDPEKKEGVSNGVGKDPEKKEGVSNGVPDPGKVNEDSGGREKEAGVQVVYAIVNNKAGREKRNSSSSSKSSGSGKRSSGTDPEHVDKSGASQDKRKSTEKADGENGESKSKEAIKTKYVAEEEDPCQEYENAPVIEGMERNNLGAGKGKGKSDSKDGEAPQSKKEEDIDIHSESDNEDYELH